MIEPQFDAPNIDHLEALADDYYRTLRRRNYRPKSITDYAYGISDWLRFCEEHPGDPLTRQHLEAWQDQLVDRGLAPRTRSLMTTAVRGLLKWAAVSDRPVPANLWMALDVVKVPRGRPRPLEPVQQQLLVDYFTPRPPATRLVALRDRATFFYQVSTSARVSEMLQLDRDGFDADVRVIQKGGSAKVLRAPQIAMEAIADYLAARRDVHPALFVTHPLRGDVPVNRLGPEDVRQAWRRAAKKLGIPYFTTHRIRHTTASILLREHVSVETVAEVLGHRGLGTVMNYAEVGELALENAREKLQEVLSTPAPPKLRLLPRLKRRPGGR